MRRSIIRVNITLAAGLRWHPLFVAAAGLSVVMAVHSYVYLLVVVVLLLILIVAVIVVMFMFMVVVFRTDCLCMIPKYVSGFIKRGTAHQVGTTNALAQLVQFSKRVNRVDVEFTLKAGGLCSFWLEKLVVTLVGTLERCVVRSIRWDAKRRSGTRELEGL